MGSAIFWDLAEDKSISGFDPRNVITIMTSPLTGTLAPGASARTEMQGIGVQSSPIGWFTRSNFGGRFGAMLKFAGWDGMVIEGRAAKPVWIDIRDEEVRIRDAGKLWGKDTWKTQQIIWQEVTGAGNGRNWMKIGSPEADKRTTQKPAVLAIGQAGEKRSRIASILHDAGNAAGQGGFGGVWGSKHLKAISVIGTGSIQVADANALMKARLWLKEFMMDVDDPTQVDAFDPGYPQPLGQFGMPSMPVVYWQRPKQARPQACIGCHSGCRSRHKTAAGNESNCAESHVYTGPDLEQNSGFLARTAASFFRYLGQGGVAQLVLFLFGKQTSSAFLAADLAQKYGINAFELSHGIPYLRDLYKMGVLGPGKEIDCDLPFDKYGSAAFIERLMWMIAHREGIGDDMAEGFYRAAKRWGRLEEDLRTGLLQYPYWGFPEHNYDPRAEIEWGYGSILGDRDINEHDFNLLFWMPSVAKWQFREPALPAEEAVRIYTEKMAPYAGDEGMLDFSTENIYSDSIVKLVAWHRYYTRFWKQSVLYCDFRYPDFYNGNAPDHRGMTGQGEQRFFNAVTGRNLSFVDGIDIGRRIWNLDNAIWTLQGRHRDLVHFADYVYTLPYGGLLKASGSLTKFYMPGRVNGTWDYIPLEGRSLDRSRFEEWKSRFYAFSGWDKGTGWPTRKTLESLGLGSVADELEEKGKLGKGD